MNEKPKIKTENITTIGDNTITRKIIGYGYSHLLCLPKYWIVQQGIKKTDLINIKITKEGNLLIKKQKKISFLKGCKNE